MKYIVIKQRVFFDKYGDIIQLENGTIIYENENKRFAGEVLTKLKDGKIIRKYSKCEPNKYYTRYVVLNTRNKQIVKLKLIEN